LILNKALSQSPEAGKLYAVRWLGVLARIRAPSFAQYGVEFLVEQLRDPSLQVISLLVSECDNVARFVASIIAHMYKMSYSKIKNSYRAVVTVLAISFFDFFRMKFILFARPKCLFYNFSDNHLTST
jgi:hypothetical protein